MTYQELVRKIKSCTDCALSKTRTNAVPGQGRLNADIMFIGEGPGYYEDQSGNPFVGQAGKVLDQLLASIGLNRSDIYITNMVKCRPPKNRDPYSEELQACNKYLDAQIAMVEPKIIVALGRFSFAKFFPNDNIKDSRGQAKLWKDIIIYPVYHPAAALHNPNIKPKMIEQFKQIPALIEGVTFTDGSTEVKEEPEFKQEGLF